MQKQVTRKATRSEEHVQSTCSPLFLLRVGGLPVNVVDALRFEEVARWRDAVLELEAMMAGRKDRLIDILHTAVNTHREDQKLRRKLIDLKRNVYNMRPPDTMRDARLLCEVLPANEQELLGEWLHLWEVYQEKYQLGQDILMQEVVRKRAMLKEVIDTPDFRKGILLSSSLLDEAAAGYIGYDNQRLNREARTVERSLVEYLLRTAYKTSPFSTLTSVCAGTIESSSAGDIRDMNFQVAHMEKRSFPKLNVALLSRLSSLLLSDAPNDVRREFPVRVTSSWWRQGSRIKYLRRRQNVEEIDANAPTILDIIHEHIFSLPAGHLQEDLLAVMREGREAKLTELIEELCTYGSSNRSEQEVEAYLLRLLKLGFLLVPNLQIDIHNGNPLAQYRKGLLQLSIPLTDGLADELEKIERLVDSYSEASVTERRELLATLKQQVRQCYALLGQPDPPLPRTLLYEDTTLEPSELAIPERKWNAVLTSLGELEQLLPIFDASLPQKLITRGYFQAKYGVAQRCDDFLLFADTFNADYFEQYLRDMASRKTLDSEGRFNRHENHFHQPEISKIDEARQVVAEYVHNAYTRMQSTPTVKRGELILGEDFLATTSALLPDHGEILQSNTFFSQFARVNGEPLLVVNQVYAGLTLMFSRFAHCFTDGNSQVVQTLRTTLESLQPGGAVLAELKGGYDATNLNLHPVVTPYELVCPGELSTRPQEQQIPLADLYVQDDLQENRLRLYSRRLGKEVIPVYLGFLVPMLLPEVQQILLNFSCLSMCAFNLWNGVKVDDSEDGLTFYPRLRYKHVVLQRAMWKMPVKLLPQRENAQSDADFYLAVSRWRKDHGLPAKAFFSTDTSASYAPLAVDEEEKTERSRKPLYVDFENYFSLALLEATVRKMRPEQRVVLSEMLPGREDLWFEHDGYTYVSEFVLEMNRSHRERK